jgi:1-acyl-sn-glycerol-3-phosphate acyltransferase
MFFPEGTFARQPGLLPFHMGAFVTAAKTQLPLVPIAIHGTRNILRPGSWLPHRGEITVTIGKPIQADVPGSESDDPWPQALLLRDQAREHIRRYSEEPEQG